MFISSFRGGRIVKMFPNLYEGIARLKLIKLNRLHGTIKRMNKLKKSKTFTIQNKCVRNLLAISMSYIPSISNSEASLFIPYILAS